MNATDSTPSTRDRLIAAMLDALRRRGYFGIGLNELLASANAPKGVLYHHFPGGKTELETARKVLRERRKQLATQRDVAAAQLKQCQHVRGRTAQEVMAADGARRRGEAGADRYAAAQRAYDDATASLNLAIALHDTLSAQCDVLDAALALL